MARLALSTKHRRLVRGILTEHLPPEAQVWVFGSRAAGRAWRYSDLDLAVNAGRRLTPDETGALSDAFEESDLPFRVDVVDWQSIGDAFRGVIAAQRQLLIDRVT